LASYGGSAISLNQSPASSASILQKRFQRDDSDGQIDSPYETCQPCAADGKCAPNAHQIFRGPKPANELNDSVNGEHQAAHADCEQDCGVGRVARARAWAAADREQSHRQREERELAEPQSGFELTCRQVRIHFARTLLAMLPTALSTPSGRATISEV
jgi:hypothetical protein